MGFLRKSAFFKLMLAALLLPVGPVLAETVEYDGLIKPYLVIDLGAPDEGIVAHVDVDRSSPIKKGQVLIELESSVERAAVEKAKAVAAFDSEIDLQQAQLAFARRVYQRVSTLEAVSIHKKDQAATEILLTGNRLEKAREKITLARLELKKAQAALARRSIKSPIAGVVVDRYVSPGEYVNSQPLLRVAQIDPLRVDVIVPAQLFGRIRPGMPATIVPELPVYAEQTAKVTLVDKVIDSASNTFGVRLDLPNTEKLVPGGLRCRVRFDIDENADAAQHMVVRFKPGSAKN